MSFLTNADTTSDKMIHYTVCYVAVHISILYSTLYYIVVLTIPLISICKFMV